MLFAGPSPVKKIKALSVREQQEEDFGRAALSNCRIPDGFVLLLTADLQPIEIVNRYTYEHCYLGAKRYNWQKTQAAYADDLAQWLIYLADKKLAWDQIDFSDIRAFGDHLRRRISPSTGEEYAGTTIRRRLCTLLNFYRWAKPDVFGPLTHSAAKLGGPNVGTIGYVRVNGRPPKPKRFGDQILPPSPHKGDSVKYIIGDALHKIMRQLGPTPYEGQPKQPLRNRLAAELAAHTGMRVAEVCSVTEAQIRNAFNGLRPNEPRALCLIRITNTKGGGERDVVVVRQLIEALYTYIGGERQCAIAKMEGLTPAPTRAVTALFVNGVDANDRDVGRPLKPATLTRVFREATLNAGFGSTVMVDAFDSRTRAEIVKDGKVQRKPKAKAKHTFHHLRHTNAMAYYRARMKAGVPMSWKMLQAKFGHKFIGTTSDIYGRFMEDHEAFVADMYDAYLAGDAE